MHEKFWLSLLSPEEYPWSSCRVHGALAQDSAKLLAPDRPFPGAMGAQEWLIWINGVMPDIELRHIRQNTSTGRPTGSQEFVKALETQLARILTRQKSGRKPKSQNEATPDMFAGEL